MGLGAVNMTFAVLSPGMDEADFAATSEFGGRLDHVS